MELQRGGGACFNTWSHGKQHTRLIPKGMTGCVPCRNCTLDRGPRGGGSQPSRLKRECLLLAHGTVFLYLRGQGKGRGRKGLVSWFVPNSVAIFFCLPAWLILLACLLALLQLSKSVFPLSLVVLLSLLFGCAPQKQREPSLKYHLHIIVCLQYCSIHKSWLQIECEGGDGMKS